jgi:hypothetical protein
MIDHSPLFLLDANVLINASNLYYPLDAVPEYWEWLAYMGSKGLVKMPFEIFDEVKEGPKDQTKDLLFAWLQKDENKNALLLKETVNLSHVQQVIEKGYAADLNDDEVEKIGRDPFLVAYGMENEYRCVVTAETSAPSKMRQNRKLPDVCNDMQVKHCNPFELNRRLAFSTQWKRAI